MRVFHRRLKINFIIYFIFMFLLWNGILFAQPQENIRAMWVTREQLTTSKNIVELVEKAQQYGFNTLFVQIRGRGELLCNLPNESRSTLIKADNFDPLAFLLTEANERNLKIHVWLNMFMVWSKEQMPENKNHILHLHPDWIISDAQKQSYLKYSYKDRRKINGGLVFLDPTNSEVRSYLFDLTTSLLKKYNVAGIHFDYFRYPSPHFGDTLDQKQRQQYLLNFLREIKQWKQANIPQVKISVAVYADYEKASSLYSQDWHGWLKEGSVDFVVPMFYDKRRKIVKKQLLAALQAAQQTPAVIIAGLGAWRLTSAEVTDRLQLVINLRELYNFQKLQGFCLFSYDRIKLNDKMLAQVKKLNFNN